jgi:hypothetical protein
MKPIVETTEERIQHLLEIKDRLPIKNIYVEVETEEEVYQYVETVNDVDTKE